MKGFKQILTIILFTIIFTGNISAKSTHILIKKKDNSIIKGELFRVDPNRILIRNSNNEIIKIPLDLINKIGVRQSRFWKGVLYGASAGAIIGIVSGITKDKVDPTGLLYGDRAGYIVVSAFTWGILGTIPGAVASPLIPKYKYYSFSTYSNDKKQKLLKKLKKKAKFQE